MGHDNPVYLLFKIGKSRYLVVCHVDRLFAAGESISVRGVESWDPAGDAISLCVESPHQCRGRKACVWGRARVTIMCVLQMKCQALYGLYVYNTPG